MTTSAPEITEVRGGILALQTDDLKRLGGTLGEASWHLVTWAGSGAIRLVDPELVASAALSPTTFVEAERAVLDAAAHLGLSAAEWGELAVLVEGVGQWFGGGEDEIRRRLDDQLGKLLGQGLRYAPELVVPAVAVAGSGTAIWWATSSSQERAAARRDFERFLTQHPGIVRDAVATLDGAIEGYTGWRTPPGMGTAASLAAQIYLDEGTARVDRSTRAMPDGRSQPHTVSDVVHHLRELTEAEDVPGLIEIQSWRDSSGQLRHVVYLPGTDDLNPFSSDSDIRDVAEDLRVAAGQRSAYVEGVEQAMRQAGINPGDPVMVAGHSLGGMAAAKMLSEGSGFNVTNVITAGSPTAVERAFPEGSHVLSLESSGDIVPQLEGQRNRISPQQTTVTFASGDDTIVGNHQPSTYERGAAAVDASHDTAVRAAVGAIQPFFDQGGQVTETTFRLSRSR